MNNGTRHRKLHVAADGVTDDVLAIQRLIDDAHAIGTPNDRAVVQLGAGTHVVSRPLMMKSNVTLRGVGPTTILHNTHDPTATPQQACCMFVGNYHPNQRHTVGGSLYHDPLDPVPALGATTATLTRNSQAITPGDLVVVYFAPDVGGSVPPQCLRKVTAVDGLDITFYPPIEHDTTTADAAFVSRGRGDFATNLSGRVYPSHLTENVTVEDLAVSSAGTWIARTACLGGVFRNITVLSSVNLIFGNAYQSCTFDQINGVFSERMVEIADGGADNTLTNITGVCDDAPAPEPSIVLGTGDTLDGFTITDVGERGTGHFKIRKKGQTITNGTITITGPLVGNLFQFGQFGSDVALSNVNVTIDGEVQDDVFRLFEFSDSTIDNVDVTTGGYAEGKYLFRVRGGLSGMTINDVQDVNGSVIYQSPATGNEPTKYVFTNCDWLT